MSYDLDTEPEGFENEHVDRIARGGIIFFMIGLVGLVLAFIGYVITKVYAAKPTIMMGIIIVLMAATVISYVLGMLDDQYGWMK